MGAVGNTRGNGGSVYATLVGRKQAHVLMNHDSVHYVVNEVLVSREIEKTCHMYMYGIGCHILD